MPQSATTQTLANYLAYGFWPEMGQPARRFDTSSSNVVAVNLTGLTAPAQAMARAALDSWEAVANIRFQEVGSGGRILFDDNAAGANTWMSPSSTISSARVVIGQDWLTKYGTGVGTYSFQTYVHEIGHALGLGHPATYSGGSDYSDAKWTIDSWQQSVMSYLNQYENTSVSASYARVVTPMMADILAIQALYGANRGGPTAGDTVYGPGGRTGTYLDAFFAAKTGTGSLERNAVTIYDASGVDTINLSHDGRAQTVNLAPGSFSHVFGLRGNLGIATNTVIENVTTGSGADTVLGNDAANTVRLGLGNDYANGDKGDDLLIGDGGHDRLVGGAGNDRLSGDSGADRLVGGDGHDRLSGGSGNDRLEGGAGADTLNGGDGADVFVIASGNDVILSFQDDRDTLLIDDALWGGRALERSQVLNYARVSDRGIVFDFPGDQSLRIENMTDIRALLDDLVIN